MTDAFYRVNELSFVWDINKEKLNIEKHGLSFETAAFVFLDALRLEQLDAKHSTVEEIRYITIGMVHDILTVVYCERGDEEAPCIRLISARQATVKERALYNNAMIGRP